METTILCSEDAAAMAGWLRGIWNVLRLTMEIAAAIHSRCSRVANEILADQPNGLGGPPTQ